MSSSTCTTDALVVGSGAAGLLAACRLADVGLDVLVVERSPVLGGTTATSGGVLWVPTNHLMAAAGYPDSTARAMEYLHAVTQGRAPAQRLEWFVRSSVEAVRYLTTRTAVRLVPLARPDHYPDAPGAAPGGRALDNLPFRTLEHPGLGEVLRSPTYLPHLTMREREEGVPDPAVVQARRIQDGERTLGGALVGALAASAARYGARLVRSTRMTAMERRAGGDWHVRIEGDEQRDVHVRTAVVLAGGGFEWDDELRNRYLPPLLPVGAPGNDGSCLTIARALGAAVDQLDTWWGAPVLQDPVARYDGRPTGRMASGELAAAGAILVDRSGQRFVDESLSYHDVGRAVASHDPVTGPRSPTWLVYDSAYARRTSVAGLPPGVTPPWAVTSETPAELARACGLPPEALEHTIARFNESARRGVDPDHGRGRPSTAASAGQGLAPLVEGPYTAVRVHAGTLGTSGGLVTDDDSRVLGESGEPIPGLLAAGNTAATVFGGAYPGGGASLALAVARAWSVPRGLAAGRRPHG